jgi:hypothetical protein
MNENTCFQSMEVNRASKGMAKTKASSSTFAKEEKPRRRRKYLFE